MSRTSSSSPARGFDIRRLTNFPEFEEAIRLEIEIWSLPEFEAMAPDALLIASKSGGQAFGAFDQDRMIGLLLAFAGIKPGGRAYLHSHMLGVLPDYRNRGIGLAMKIHQRDDALARSLDLIEWTFDPLEIKNAYLNIERLGAIVRRYSLNEYGITASLLHGGLPTDRCVAEWWIATPRVQARLAGEEPAREIVEDRIEVPVSIDVLRRENPVQAREVQRNISEKFLKCFDSGLSVVGFEVSEESGVYLLGPGEESHEGRFQSR